MNREEIRAIEESMPTGDKACFWCKHFTAKIMMNGYHGVCNKRNAFCIAKAANYCEFYDEKAQE